ncbi:YdcF family protein [Rhodococcus sp. IEGM 1408]|uniref:YdcF family protein n=1 Tax=Rhodococcus sp. IEGM 1408 TaxID=3082220 RepID=UPI002952A12A|nr:YdcF family protein [Rhodococcus sp. IEGM 1408]MDV7999807.1 YdcF family protein [Rhodococcus sp. IEGM 1408]
MRLAAVAATAAMALGTGLGAGAGTASAGSAEIPSGAALYSGLTMLGCQNVDKSLLPVCGDFEVLTVEDPAVLTLNPFTTDIVILGAGLFPDGGIRPVLEERLRTGFRLATEYPTARIIVTGGLPQNGRTEARAMGDWLRGAGIAQHRITEEGNSASTVQNAQYTDRILRDRGTTGAVVVTTGDHVQRAVLNFRQAVDGRIPVTGVVARD